MSASELRTARSRSADQRRSPAQSRLEGLCGLRRPRGAPTARAPPFLAACLLLHALSSLTCLNAAGLHTSSSHTVLAALQEKQAQQLEEVAARQQAGAKQEQQGSKPAWPLSFRYPVWWHAPFWSGTGYSSEAINYMLSMLRSGSVAKPDLWLSQHGDNDRKEVKQGMQPDDRQDLVDMEQAVNRSRPAIIVCHSLPTNWMYPSPMGWAGAKCPPDPRDAPFVYLIGRTMFETDRLPASFVPRCNAMNEVWVPSEFSREVFIASGVVPSKLRVVPEGINTSYFDPDRHTPMPMPQGELVFGLNRSTSPPSSSPQLSSSSSSSSSRAAGQQGSKGGGGPEARQAPGGPEVAAAGGEAGGQQRPFRFLSTFKWEGRKGWDVLLGAYFQEFTQEDNVELIIITKPFMGGGDFKRQMHAWAEKTARIAYMDKVHAAQAAAGARAGAARAAEAARAAATASGAAAGSTGFEAAALQNGRRLRAVVTTLSGHNAADSHGSLDWSEREMPVQFVPFQFNASLLPRLYVVQHHIADADFPRYYKAVDAFVLPSRGEGWGRPHVEAMAMGLPVISTNWSGITAYLDDSVGYPLNIEGLVMADPAVWWFKGLKWAQPSVSHLRQLMRRVVTHPDEARAKGAAARARMVEKFSPEAIGPLLAKELKRVDDLIP